MTRTLGAGSIAVYNAIEEFYSLNECSPGYKEIMAMTGFTSKATIGHHLNRLEQAGWIIREHKKQHAIVPVKYPRVYYRLRRLAADTHGWMCPTHFDAHDSPNGRNPDAYRILYKGIEFNISPNPDSNEHFNVNTDTD
jgi:SOS-response transcriptional repressor LexA